MVEENRYLNICLYTAIPEDDQFRPLASSWLLLVKSAVRNYVNHALTVLTGQLPSDLYHYQVANGLDDNSNRGDISIRLAVREQIQDAFGKRRVKFKEIKWASLTNDIVDEINRECDLFVIAGGGYLFLTGNGSGGRSFADVPFLQAITCPVVAYGIGLNRLMHENICDLRDIHESTKDEIRKFSSACAQIGVRDAHTMELLELYGDKPISLIGDPVLFLGYSRNLPSIGGPKSHPVVGINLAVHSWRALAVLRPLLPNFIELLKHVQSSLNANLTYLLHHDYEEVVVDFFRQRGIEMDVVRGSAQNLLAAYGTMDFVISQMLHSCIFASNKEVPFLNIAYDHKSIAFCELMGIPECAVPHHEATSDLLKSRFDFIFENRDGIRSAIVISKKTLKTAQGGFVYRMENLVGEK
jgi:polysaccharide pyruvyl transferase WcaK-like protein